MCLEATREETDALVKRMERTKKKEIVAYKVVNYYCGALRTIFQYVRYTIGRNCSSLTLPESLHKSRKKDRWIQPLPRFTRTEIAVGSHVFLSRKEAEDFVLPGQSLLLVWCKLRHLVAAGKFGIRSSAVFSEVHVTPHAYKKALK